MEKETSSEGETESERDTERGGQRVKGSLLWRKRRVVSRGNVRMRGRQGGIETQQLKGIRHKRVRGRQREKG